MNNLILKSENKAILPKGKYKRYLHQLIDWNQRMILILGYRGVGKTTLLLQNLSEATKRGIYLNLDDLYFEKNRLVETVANLYQLGYRLFLLDEVHRYGFWSKDLKQLYDDYADIHLVATGSSILDLAKGNADLSRRAAVYQMEGLSFREFLIFQKKNDFPVFSLEDVVARHHQIAPEMLDLFSFEREFPQYLKFGYFPFFMESKTTYFQRLEETINQVIDADIAPFEELQHATIRTMKKLLFVLSESVPFTPNINKLSERMETNRNTLLRLLDILNQARILKLLKSGSHGSSYLQKPEKIYLNNPNFIHLFSPTQPNVGGIRETFFFNQVGVNHQVVSSKYGDFLVDGKFVFEIGGASKTRDQIKGVPESYLALDIENGNEGRIPLWLFGFLY